MEDRDKIQAKIDELKAKDINWDEADGFSLITSIKYDLNNGGYAVNPASGIPVKLFINTESGEMITLWAKKFMKDDK